MVERKYAALGGVLFVVLLAGCMSASVETTVSEDGTLEEQVIEVELEKGAYEMMAMDEEEFMQAPDEEDDGEIVDQTEMNGNGDLEEEIMDDIDTEGWEDVEYHETFDEETSTHLITITLQEGDPAAIDTIDTSVEDGEISFVDYEGFDTEEDATELDSSMGIEMEHTLQMPGEIIDANGGVNEDGQSVTWTYEEHDEVDTLEATSEQPETADTLPGFGVGLTLGVLLTVALGVRALRRR